MLRSFWRTVDRFSLQHFKHIVNQLQGIKVVDKFNREAVIDILQSIVEIVTYGDQHDPSIFECFMELQVLAEFVRMLTISRDSRIEASVLQYTSIMIQNLQSEHAIYYCFSNDYINSIITHEYEFNAGDIALYYVSFLRTVSAKLSRDTLCLLVKVQEDAVTSFPLYTEAIRFAHHGEKMIQTAIRSLTLSIYNVSDDMVYRFLMAPPVSEYFSDLVLKVREEFVHLDATVSSLRDNYTSDKRKELLCGIDKLLDDLYYIKDLLCVGKSYLSAFLIQKILGLLAVPIVIPLMELGQTSGVKISAVTSLYLLSCLVQVVDNKEILDAVVSLVLYPHLSLSSVPVTEADVLESSQLKPTSEQVYKIEQVLGSTLMSQELYKDKSVGQLLENKFSTRHFFNCQWNNVQERGGILSYIVSDNEEPLLASLMLLLILAESDDLDCLLASVLGFPQSRSESADCAVSKLSEGSFFMQCMPQILNAVLKILGSMPSSQVLTQWHAGWSLLKLISLQRAILNHQELQLFNVSIRLNASFHLARECLLAELNGCWFDHIPDTFKKEWTTCKKALEVSSRKKDPLFILELAYNKSSDGHGIDAWQKMVDTVKIFVLHVLLKAYVTKGFLPDEPLKTLRSSSLSSPRSSHASDASSAKFGSLVPLGSGVPCKIAFSKLGIRDIFMIPVAKGLSGRLLLAEKHPFHSRSGVVLAMAPLAGLSPKIDEKRNTWLHLQIRDFNPTISRKRNSSNSSSPENVVRWTVGFPDADACEAARLLINEETCKLRYVVENLLAPFLYDHFPDEEADNQAQ